MTDFEDLLHRQSSDAAIVAARDGAVLHWSKGAEAMFGYNGADCVGRSYIDLIIPPDRRHQETDFLDGAFAEARAAREILCCRENGLLVYAIVTIARARAVPDGSSLIIVVAKDVTAVASSATSSCLSRVSAVCWNRSRMASCWSIRPAMSFWRTANAGGCSAMLPGALRAMPIETLLPHHLTYFREPRMRTMGTGLELFGCRRDGSEFPVEVSLSPLHLEDDAAFVFGAVRDVSDRRRAEQKYRGLLEAAPDAMVVVNQSSEIVLLNVQAERQFGYRRDELLGREIETIVPAGFAERLIADDLRSPEDALAQQIGTGIELTGRRKDGGDFPIEIMLSPLDSAEGILVTAAIRDITQRKDAERALVETNLKLESANKAKDRFLAGMSHELRTPLNSVIGFTGTLLMKLPGPLNADQERQLRMVQTGARHLLSLINDLLDLAKIEAGQMEMKLEPVACRAVIEEAAATLRPQAVAKGLGFTLAAPANEVMLISDRRALSQITLNLMGNAIKFTEHGDVAMTLAMENVDGRRTLSLSVQDTGIGIAVDDQKKLFTAFARMNVKGPKAYEGTGLGLHLSQKLAIALGGRIEFRSTAGQGSQFTLLLPED